MNLFFHKPTGFVKYIIPQSVRKVLIPAELMKSSCAQCAQEYDSKGPEFQEIARKDGRVRKLLQIEKL